MLKRFSFTILIPLLLVGASVFILIKMQPAPLKVTNRHIPTVFIHGYAGNDRSFHGMIRRFSEKYHWGTESLHIRVDTSGKLHTQGSYPTDAKNPLINIVFDDNRASIAQQSAWTKKAMRYLKKHYAIKKFYAVGHSMGGGTWISYLATEGDNPVYPMADKIVFLGVPFYPEEYLNGSEEVVINHASYLHGRFAKRISQVLPKKTQILIIGGDILDGSKSDGEVSAASVRYGKKIFTKQQLSLHILKSKDANHSALHELPIVDNYISDFLWR